MNAIWRIEQLSELVAQALQAVAYDGQPSARVRDVPDVRTIRYYTTIGLLDRPVEMRGRTAYYGRRHLLQLVAVKRLQSQGRSLVQIQQTLAGASDSRLAQWADLPAGFFDMVVPSTADTLERWDDQADLRPFWAEIPERCAEPTPVRPEIRLRSATILPLDSGVSLVLEGVAPEQLSEATLVALQPAVAMLRESLIRAGLCGLGDVSQAGQSRQHFEEQEKPE